MNAQFRCLPYCCRRNRVRRLKDGNLGPGHAEFATSFFCHHQNGSKVAVPIQKNTGISTTRHPFANQDPKSAPIPDPFPLYSEIETLNTLQPPNKQETRGGYRFRSLVPLSNEDERLWSSIQGVDVVTQPTIQLEFTQDVGSLSTIRNSIMVPVLKRRSCTGTPLHFPQRRLHSDSHTQTETDSQEYKV